MWTHFFNEIFVINLDKRPDRMKVITPWLKKYKIPFTRVSALEHYEKPCVGLVDTMQELFEKCLNKKYQSIMILEDDATPLVEKEEFNKTMDGVVKQIPDDWDILYLGCNAAGGFQKGFYSPNLLPVELAYATHAACYSKRAMQFLTNILIYEPIDNFIVREFQPNHNIYCTYPMLVTQVPGYSDIDKGPQDWHNELEVRYEEQLKLIPK